MTRTPLVPSDLYRLALPRDPQNAGGGGAFFVLTTHDEAADDVRTALWLARGGAVRPFTSGPQDGLPRLSPDGAHLAFVSERGDGKRVYTLPLSGGEARALTGEYDAIVALAWAPDARSLAFVATAPLDPATARIALDERSGARHIRKLPFKSDDVGLLDGRRKALYVATFPEGEVRRLVAGDFDVSGPSWSPDSKRIAFAAQVGMPETSFCEDIFTVDVAGGVLARLTASNGPMAMPAFSHDGREIAFLGHLHGDDVGGRFNTELLVVDADGGEVRSLSAAVDRPVVDFVICDVRSVGGQQAPVWGSGDLEIFVLLSRDGTSGVVAFARDGSHHRVVAGGERDISAFSCAPDGSVAFAYSTPLVPGEVALLDAFGNEERLTDCNPWIAERAVRAPRRVRPQTADGWALDLWILDPDEPAGAPYVLQVHGGPHTAYGYGFLAEFQMLASHGIGVAYGNPRGSQTYGHAFADAVTGDWGGIDTRDVLTLADALVESAPLDPAKLGIAGGSYGGFMTTWLLGHTKRFAAGISMRAVNDFVSEVGAADLGWFLEREVGAAWTDDAGAKLFALSPMRAAHEIDVPLLIEHSERDYRCPIDQGEQLFTLLRRLGRTNVEFVRFTGDGHNLSRTGKPRNRVLRLRAIAHWFIRHLRPAGIEPAPDEAGVLFAPLASEL